MLGFDNMFDSTNNDKGQKTPHLLLTLIINVNESLTRQQEVSVNDARLR